MNIKEIYSSLENEETKYILSLSKDPLNVEKPEEFDEKIEGYDELSFQYLSKPSFSKIINLMNYKGKYVHSIQGLVFDFHIRYGCDKCSQSPYDLVHFIQPLNINLCKDCYLTFENKDVQHFSIDQNCIMCDGESCQEYYNNQYFPLLLTKFFYHKENENFDLCEDCYSSSEDKEGYIRKETTNFHDQTDYGSMRDWIPILCTENDNVLYLNVNKRSNVYGCLSLSTTINDKLFFDIIYNVKLSDIKNYEERYTEFLQTMKNYRESTFSNIHFSFEDDFIDFIRHIHKLPC